MYVYAAEVVNQIVNLISDSNRDSIRSSKKVIQFGDSVKFFERIESKFTFFLKFDSNKFNYTVINLNKLNK